MARKKNRRSVRGKARRRARKKVPLGVLLWTALILFVLVVFLFNRVAIRDVIDRTELLTVLQHSVDNAMGLNQPAADAAPLPEVTRSPLPPATADDTVPPPGSHRDETRPQVVATDPAPASEAALPAAAPAAPNEAALPVAETTPATAPAQQDASPQPTVPSARQRRLFFAAVSDAGDIAVTGVMRTVDETKPRRPSPRP